MIHVSFHYSVQKYWVLQLELYIATVVQSQIILRVIRKANKSESNLQGLRFVIKKILFVTFLECFERIVNLSIIVVISLD